MTPKHKRILFWSIFTVCVIASVWWLFHFPYSRECLYRAVPGNAVIIGEHPGIAGRWVTCLKTPAVRGILNAQGVTDEQIDEAIGNPELANAIEAFAGRNAVMAYVPALDTSRRPAWLFASWAGAYCQPLRWGWAHRRMKDFERVSLDHGKRMWRLKPGKLGGGMHLTVAATEGILLGCLSADPYGVRHILDRIDQKLPLTRRAQKVIGTVNGAARVEDNLWFQWHVDMGEGFATYESTMGMTLKGEAGSSGWFRSDFLPSPSAAGAVSAADVGTIEKLVGNVPDAVMVGDLAGLLSILPASPGWEDARKIADTVAGEAAEGSGGFLALLAGRDYLGEIAGPKIAAIVAGVRLKDGVAAADAVGRVLDKLNADYGLSLIPKRVEGDLGVIGLNSTRPGTFKLFPAGERPAFAGVDGWLLFGTNRKALEKLLTMDRSGNCRWVDNMERGPGICVAGDLEETGKAVENALAAYTLIMDIQAGKKNKDLAACLDMVKAWARVGSVLKTGTFRLHAPDGQPEVRFEFAPR